MSRAARFAALYLCTVLSCFAVGQATPPPAPAKQDQTQEAFVYDQIDNLVRFEDDGTGIRDTTAVIRIQSQAGVQEFGQLIFGYSAATENLEIQYVRVRKPDGHVVETQLSTAQDFAPDVLKEAPTYSDYRQRHVSVVGIQPGDVLEYRTIVHVTTPLASHEFWYEHVFPIGAVIHSAKLEIDIPKAREVKLKSPKRNYETRENGDRRIYTWTIHDYSPDRRPDREQNPALDFEPDVQLSSFSDWQQVGRWYARLQSARAVPDDALRKEAAELTRGAATPTEKARRLYNYVALNIRYVSLSFGVGRLQPHAANEVFQNGYGDCKDKHTLLQALLNAAGIESYPVLINSFRKLDPDVPSPGQFDHVITAAKLGPDFTWLDTTAEVAPYGLIMYQLRNKQALLAVDGPAAGLVRTTADVPVKNVFSMKFDGRFTETGAIEATLDLTAQGDSDLPLRAAFRRMAQADWQTAMQNMARMWGTFTEVSDMHVDPLEDTTKPFHLTYRIRQDNYFRVPSSSIDFRLLPPIGLPVVAVNSKKPTEPLDVGPAVERIYRAHIQFPANYTVHVPSTVKMSRDYGDYSSSYSLSKGTLDAERRLLFKVNELPASRRSDYDSFRNATANETDQLLSCSITAVAGAHGLEVSSTATPAELQKLGTGALDRHDFGAAVDLLKRVTAADPQRKDAWDQLGRAYAGLGQHDDAIAAFRKQIEIDAFHSSANEDLAGELRAKGQLDDAVAAYRKQVEITPYEKGAHKNLGLLLVQMKRDPDAQTELEAAAGIPPEDPEISMALAQLYSRTGNSEKAAAMMHSVTGGSASAGSDMFASALRDDIDPGQTLTEARQTLDQIGDQFDSGNYDRQPSSALSAMNLVALAWSRIGWAKFLQNENMESMQFLNAAWLLSESGTVGNRLGRLYEKEGQKDKALHMFALSAVLNGPDAQASRDHARKLAVSSDAADQEIAKASAELIQMRTIKLPALANGGSAGFILTFDSSSKPERADFVDGDASLRALSDKLREREFPIRFPDISSVKIVRRGTLTCEAAGCTVVLQAPESPQSGSQPAATSSEKSTQRQ